MSQPKLPMQRPFGGRCSWRLSWRNESCARNVRPWNGPWYQVIRLSPCRWLRASVRGQPGCHVIRSQDAAGPSFPASAVKAATAGIAASPLHRLKRWGYESASLADPIFQALLFMPWHPLRWPAETGAIDPHAVKHRFHVRSSANAPSVTQTAKISSASAAPPNGCISPTSAPSIAWLNGALKEIRPPACRPHRLRRSRSSLMRRSV